MPTVPATEIERRLLAVRERSSRLAEPPDALLVLQRADLYYLSGTIQQAHLILPREGSPRLLVRKVLERAREDSPLDDVRPFSSLRELPEHLGELCGPPPWRIGMELDVLPVASMRRYAVRLGEGTEIVDASGAILAARAIKSAWEVERFREAGDVLCRMFARLPELLREEQTSFQLQKRIDWELCRLGHCGVVRLRGLDAEAPLGLVVCGREGAVPGHSIFPVGGPGPHPWAAGGGGSGAVIDDVPIVVDYLSSTSGYHADCTRTAVRGALPEPARRALESLRAILRRIEERLVPGAVPAAIWRESEELAAEAGLSDGFMGPPGHSAGFVGHGVGLEVNETPVLARRFEHPLEAGNVIAVEPKYASVDWGMVGLENTYLVTQGGPDLLTPVSEDVIR